MRTRTDAARRRVSLSVAAIALLVGACAHAPEEREASAGPATDRDEAHHVAEYEGAPRGAPENPYDERYADLEAEVTMTGRVALDATEPHEIRTPDDPQDDYVAVSAQLPVGTIVRVTRMDDGRSVIVAVRRNEQMPEALLAMSRVAGQRLGLMDRAVIPAQVEVLVSPEARIR